MEDNSKSFLYYVALVYLIISQFAAVYHFIQSIKASDSILYAIFISPIVGEVKGLLWVFFL